MHMELAGQMDIMEMLGISQGGPSGKTSPEHSPVTKERTSDASSRPSAISQNKVSPFLLLRKDGGLMQEASWEMVSPWHGGSLIYSTSEQPRSLLRRGDGGFTLSQILEESVPEKYCLSAKACNGILQRASKRGKTLPTLLLEALKEVVENADGCKD